MSDDHASASGSTPAPAAAPAPASGSAPGSAPSARAGRNLSIQVVMLPKDTNGNGTIFGGVILSQIDLAAAVEASRHTRHRIATVAMREVEFHRPVHVGDVVSFYTRLVRTGNTSLTVHVDVEALRWGTTQAIQVTEAEVIFVAVNKRGDKVPVASEPVP